MQVSLCCIKLFNRLLLQLFSNQNNLMISIKTQNVLVTITDINIKMLIYIYNSMFDIGLPQSPVAMATSGGSSN